MINNELEKYTAKQALDIASVIAMQVKLGNKSYSEGKREAEPFLEIANKKIAEIAKKYGKRPYTVPWAKLCR